MTYDTSIPLGCDLQVFYTGRRRLNFGYDLNLSKLLGPKIRRGNSLQLRRPLYKGDFETLASLNLLSNITEERCGQGAATVVAGPHDGLELAWFAHCPRSVVLTEHSMSNHCGPMAKRTPAGAGAPTTRRPAPEGAACTLSDAETAFVRHYLNCFNVRVAAQRCGLVPTGESHRAWEVGAAILRREHVRATVDGYLDRGHAGALEVLHQLCRIAFADLAQLREVLAPVEYADRETGEPKSREPMPHEMLERAERLGVSQMIKGIKRTAHGTDLELHDAQRALETLARHHKLVGAEVAVPLTGEIVVDLRVKDDQGGDQEASPLGYMKETTDG